MRSRRGVLAVGDDQIDSMLSHSPGGGLSRSVARPAKNIANEEKRMDVGVLY